MKKKIYAENRPEDGANVPDDFPKCLTTRGSAFIDDLQQPSPEFAKACAEIVRAYAKKKAQEFGIEFHEALQTELRSVVNGYDYEKQAWVVDGKYVRCGHPDEMNCGCYGREHEGEKYEL